MTRKRILYIAAAFILIFIVGGLLIDFWPESDTTKQKSVCRIEARSCYAIPLDANDTIYLPLKDNDINHLLANPNDITYRIDLSGVFISREGHLLTSDSLVLHAPDSLSAQRTREGILRMDTLVNKAQSAVNDMLKELDIYAKSHSVIDDGYNDVMDYRAKLNRQLLRIDTVKQTLTKAINAKQPLHAKLLIKAHILFSQKDDSGHVATVQKDVEMLQHTENGPMLFQTTDHKLPKGAKHVHFSLISYKAAPTMLTAFADFGGATAHTLAESIVPDSVLPHSAEEGGLWSGAWGHACGIQIKDKCCTTETVRHTMAQELCRMAWWWINLRGWLRSLFSPTNDTPQNESMQNKKCVCMHLPNGSHYNGQGIVHKGIFIREGEGTYIDSCGSTYTGLWQADTLTRGTRSDTLGYYSGKFNSRLRPEGMGIYITREGEHYEGEWADGIRQGHGFSVKAGIAVRCGVWRKNRFYGERMVYTTDRVYGIDLSRYQHEIGKKKYGIDWDRLRIVSLGNGRRVKGTVDYPVSYIYLKATQGTRITNKYYASDLRQARSHGIPVGSYHFYSSKYKGAEQAAWFLRMAWVAPSDLPPVLDLEPTEAEVKEMGGEQEMFRQVLVWLRTVEQRRGKKPVLYVGQQFVNNHLIHAPEALRTYDVWIARYGEYKPFVRLLHWQLTPYGRVRGIHGEVDINVYNGTKTQFREYIDSICKR